MRNSESRKNEKIKNNKTADEESPIQDSTLETKKDEKKKKKNKHKKSLEEEKAQQEDTPTEAANLKRKLKIDDPEDDAIKKKKSGEDDVEIGGGKEVFVSGNDVKELKYTALSSFDEAKLPEEVLECCKGFNKPSPIDLMLGLFFLDGRDFIGIAASALAKRWRLGFQIFMHIRRTEERRDLNPLAFVLSPTRELARKLQMSSVEAGKSRVSFRFACMEELPKDLKFHLTKEMALILLSNPAALKDLIEMGFCCLKEVSYVVLDEADRMLDMGFEPKSVLY
ncbi:hypothetical protein IFM89_018745 [Coptis chinensis]|uniref:Helicase ATP-binding domain-containing protein n=1 Tax=Coptis chinensis TaxID=261450 RepID=A0A835HN65_9MAGN|nr:hypothetical protein IFM89_018745 [Coptis chinensis]